MTNNEILNEINELKQKLKELENKAQNLQENEYKRWRASEDENYWYVASNGDIYDDCEYYEEPDNFRYSIGNYFRTQQEAQEYKENLITKQKLKDLALRLNKGVEIDWNKDDCYCIYLDYKQGLQQEGESFYVDLGNVYCLDENFLDIAIQEIGEEALIKLIKSGV